MRITADALTKLCMLLKSDRHDACAARKGRHRKVTHAAAARHIVSGQDFHFHSLHGSPLAH